MKNIFIWNDEKYKIVKNDCTNSCLCSKCIFGVFIHSENDWRCIGPREIIFNSKCNEANIYFEKIK